MVSGRTNMKMKIVKLLTLGVVALFALFTACKKDTFVETPGLVCPEVLRTSPISNATNVPLDSVITVTFSQEMDPRTMIWGVFTLKDANDILGVVTYDNSSATLIFTPNAPLPPNTTFIGKVTTEAKDPRGNRLQEDYVWTFSTGATLAPKVITTSPVDSAVGVPLNKIITAGFNMPMDPLTLNAATFTLKQGANSIPGQVGFANTTSTFVPTNPLTPNTLYTATITTGAKNLAGTALASNYTWSFTTQGPLSPFVVATDPVDVATGVAFDKTITASFSAAMDPATITSSSFLLRSGVNPVPGTVSYAGTTASFNPTADLSPNTVYTATITTLAKTPAGTALASNYTWTFTTQNPLLPSVISTDPADQAIGVPLNKTVTATFSEVMNPATITSSSFLLKNGANTVPGTVSYAGSTASYNPTADLSPNTVYTATITTLAKTPAGTALASNYTWTFTTQDAQSPFVLATDPVDLAIGVPLNKTVTATFSEVMNPATITSSSFLLKTGGNTVPGTVSYAGATASYNPTADLSPNTVYTATITTLAKNPAGIALASNYTWTFTTQNAQAPFVVSTDPVNLAIGVAFNKTVAATFNEMMDPTTITSSSFTLTKGGNSVPGTVSYLGFTASYNPTADLSPNTVYTATITTLAKNIVGVALASNYTWTFTTLNAPAPFVVSTDPANMAIGVAFNKTVTATFNEQMDPATITSSSFLLKTGVNTIPGTVSYTGSTASYNPTANLSPNTVYTATITTLAKNLAGIALVSNYTWTFTTQNTQPPFVDLGSALNFGILAGVGVSNNAGFSEIHDMNVGIYPGVRSSISGFPPAIIVNGVMYASDDIAPPGVNALLQQAQTDLVNAYLFAEGATNPAPAIVSGDQGGLTLAPGIYKSNSTLLIQSGDLTLDAQGDPNATWIFQVASGFTTIGGAGGSVILSGGAKASNVFWQVGSSAVIGDNTIFKGNVLALTSITMNSNAVAQGRMLAQNGSVVMTNNNRITKP